MKNKRKTSFSVREKMWEISTLNGVVGPFTYGQIIAMFKHNNQFRFKIRRDLSYTYRGCLNYLTFRVAFVTSTNQYKTAGKVTDYKSMDVDNPSFLNEQIALVNEEREAFRQEWGDEAFSMCYAE